MSTTHIPTLAPRPPPLADRMARHRNTRRPDDHWQRAIVDVLRLRRETAENPPDLLKSFNRVTELSGTDRRDELRVAAAQLAVAALAVVTSLPARDLMEDLDK